MKMSIQVIATNIVAGKVEDTLTIDDSVIRKISFEETVGDEFFTKASDIYLETTDPLPEIDLLLSVNWLVLYIDGMLYNVYKHPLNYLEFDEKFGIYRYRCDPIQKIFYDDLAATAIAYNNTDTWHWNYNLVDTWVDAIILPDEVGASLTGRVIFAVRLILDALIGQWLVSNGYYIDDIEADELNLPVSLLGEIAFLWRGESFVDGVDSDEDIVNGTFKASAGGDQFNMTWLDIFKIVIAGWNAFVRVKPVIKWSDTYSQYVLGVQVEIVPKSSRTPGTGKSLTWIDRKIITEKYKVDGVKITGTNFTLELGDVVTSGNIVEKEIGVADYLETLTDPTLELYLAEGHFTIAVGYSIDYPWFASPSDHGDEFYGSMITTGDGITGNCKLIFLDDGTPAVLRPLDQVEVNEQTAQITTIRADGSGIASVEGILLD